MNSFQICLALVIWLLYPSIAAAKPTIAVLDFELRDLTLLPGVPKEIARTATIKPLLEQGLTAAGYTIVSIPVSAQREATAGFGYLFDHHDAAAQLGQRFKADYVIVGRLHKPSYLFVYLMVHLVDTKKQMLTADYLSEVKGGEEKLTGKGVESLIDKINLTFEKVD